MSQTLLNAYNEIIADFKIQNRAGSAKINLEHLVKEPTYLKTEEKKGLLSWYFTRLTEEGKLVIHLYCYDRCRAKTIQPDGNRITVNLVLDGNKQVEVFSWLDKPYKVI